jgi:hypothetical protein
MRKTYYMQVRIRTISFRSDDGPPPPLRLELQHEPVPTKRRRGLLSWLRRPPESPTETVGVFLPREQPTPPLQIPWSPSVGAKTALGLGCLWLASCAPNPNVNVYGWQPPPGPSPYARSYLGYDPEYEQKLINQYTATHPDQVQAFRRQQLGL